MNKLKVTGVKDKKTRKNIELIANAIFDDYEEIILALTTLRLKIITLYGIDIPTESFDGIIEAIMKRDQKKGKK